MAVRGVSRLSRSSYIILLKKKITFSYLHSTFYTAGTICNHKNRSSNKISSSIKDWVLKSAGLINNPQIVFTFREQQEMVIQNSRALYLIRRATILISKNLIRNVSLNIENIWESIILWLQLIFQPNSVTNSVSKYVSQLYFFLSTLLTRLSCKHKF